MRSALQRTVAARSTLQQTVAVRSTLQRTVAVRSALQRTVAARSTLQQTGRSVTDAPTRDRRSKQCEPDQVALRGDLWYSKSSSCAMARATALAVSNPLAHSFVTSNIHDPPFSGMLRTIGSRAAGWSDVPAATRSLERQSRSNLFVRTSVALQPFRWNVCRAATRPPQKFAARISDPPGGRVNLTGDGQRRSGAVTVVDVNELQEPETVRSTFEFPFLHQLPKSTTESSVLPGGG